jgi:transketolase
MRSSQQLATCLRKKVLEMTHRSGASHIGAAFSMVDIIAVLYQDIMRVFPENPGHEDRDRFILSKGHAGVAVYAVLAEQGFFDKVLLDSFYQDGSALSGHISHIGVPGVEFSTGSLGHGVCVAAGMALAARMDGRSHRIFSVMGDGECQEGSVWEMATFAAHNALSNLIVLIDHNKLQSLDTLEKTMSVRNLGERWAVFGWDVTEVDGHDHNQLRDVLLQEPTGKPRCIIAHTVKGKGVSFMENQVLWHYRDPQGVYFERAMVELNTL